MPLKDAHGRVIRDLRISLTDRCNFRCFYCLPNGEPPLARRSTILTFEEIERLAKIFVSLGIEKIRLTGGEPMLRRGIGELIARLARSKPELKDLALTTNGHGVEALAATLKDASLDRVTLSLDSLDRENFKNICGIDGLDETLRAFEALKLAGFSSVKMNAVIVRGRNDHEIVDLARFARENEVDLRFIEFMPLDSGHDWDLSLVVSGKEIRETIDRVFDLIPSGDARGSSTAATYTFKDGSAGSIGIIAPVTEMFCGACSRIRLTADGQLRTCLFSTGEYDLRDVMRSGASDEAIIRVIEDAVFQKEASHHINDPDFVPASRSMSFIGG